MNKQISLDISRYAVDTKYLLDSKNSTAVYCVDIPILVKFLEMRYRLEPRQYQYETWSVEMFKDNRWIVEIRIYHPFKDIRDFDLCLVPGKRRCAKLIGVF